MQISRMVAARKPRSAKMTPAESSSCARVGPEMAGRRLRRVGLGAILRRTGIFKPVFEYSMGEGRTNAGILPLHSVQGRNGGSTSEAGSLRERQSSLSERVASHR